MKQSCQAIAEVFKGGFERLLLLRKLHRCILTPNSSVFFWIPCLSKYIIDALQLMLATRGDSLGGQLGGQPRETNFLGQAPIRSLLGRVPGEDSLRGQLGGQPREADPLGQAPTGSLEVCWRTLQPTSSWGKDTT